MNLSESDTSRKFDLFDNTDKIIFEFNVEGMTCIACSQTIERAMKNEFNSKGLIDVQIAVLTHKMRITFNYKDFQDNQLSPEKIAEEVEMVGFSAELHETIIDNSKKLRDDQFNSESDLGSCRS